MNDKTIIVDFDDTICFTKNRKWDEGKPNKDLINKLNKLYDQGFYIKIYTARGSISCKSRKLAKEKYGESIIKWLKKHNVKYHILSFLHTRCRWRHDFLLEVESVMIKILKILKMLAS